MSLNKLFEYLSTHTLDELQQDYGVEHTKHEDGRVILNYSQINSPKHSISNVCRGLVIEFVDNKPKLVAKAFDRFFNVGENPQFDKSFDFDNSVYYTKEDGSLILLYYWKDKWHVNTRGSFGNGIIGDSGYTWRELFWSTLNFDISKKLDDFRHLTFVFELCTRYNKVVIDYPFPTSYLLSVFEGEKELSIEDYNSIRLSVGFNFPFQIKVSSCSIEHIKQEINRLSENKLFEGLVLRSPTNERVKIKSADYIKLHRLKNNGNGFLIKNLVPIILSGEKSELLAYFPEQADKIHSLEKRIRELQDDITSIYNGIKHIPDQKTFALNLTKLKHPLQSLAFNAKRLNVDINSLMLNETTINLFIKILELESA